MPINILHIDDDEADHYLLKRLISHVFEKYELLWVKNKQDFKSLSDDTFSPDVIILDYVFKGYNALEIIPLIKPNFPRVPLLLLTAFEGPGIELELAQLGLNDIFKKKELSAFGSYLRNKFNHKALKLAEPKLEIDESLNQKFKKVNEALELAKNRNFLLPLVSFHSQPVMMLNDRLEVILVNESGKEFFGELLKLKLENLPLKFEEQIKDKSWINIFKKGFTANDSLELKIKDTPFQLFLNHQNNTNGTSFLLVVAASWSKVNSLVHSTTFNTEKLVDLYDKESSIIVQFDLAGKIVFCSSNILKVVGFAAEELIGRSISDLNAGIFENNFVQNEFQKLLIDPTDMRVGQGEMRKKDFSFINVFYRAKGVVDLSGNLQGVICVFRDISEHLRLTQNLEKSEESLKLVSANVSDLVAVVDENFTYNYVSLSAQTLVGYSADELLGKSISFLLPAEDIKQVKDDFEAVILAAKGGKQDFIFRHRLQKKAGDIIWVESVINVHTEQTSGELKLITSTRSIDEKVKITEELKRTKQVLHLVSEIQQAYIIGKSLNDSFTNLLSGLMSLVNYQSAYIISFDTSQKLPNYLSIWGKSGYEQSSFFDINTLLDRMPELAIGNIQSFNNASCNTGFESCLAMPVLFENKLLAVLAFGSEQNNLNASLGEFLGPVETLIAALIINDRKSKELILTKDKLAKSKSELSAIIGSIEDIIIEVNDTLLIEAIWIKDESLLLVPKEELLNMPILYLAEKFGLLPMFDLVKEVFADGVSRSFEYASPIDGTGWFFARINKVVSNSTQLVCIVISDVSLSKKAEAEIQKNADKEKELIELRSRFVAMTSHEFRTPLATISTSSELLSMVLEAMNMDPKSKLWRYASNIQNGVARMVGLIDDVLFLGKLDSGNMRVETVPINLTFEIKEIINKLNQIDKIPHLPVFEIRGSEKFVMFDFKILEHVVENLLLNAFKYNVGDKLPKLELLYNSSETILNIIDYGIGIPEEDQKKLFSQYFRASNVGEIPGTGLGLSITKRLLDLSGCQVQVLSKVNEGTTFKITFPVSV